MKFPHKTQLFFSFIFETFLELGVWQLLSSLFLFSTFWRFQTLTVTLTLSFKYDIMTFYIMSYIMTLTFNCYFYIIAIIKNFINKFSNNLKFTIIWSSRMLKNDIHSHWCYYYYIVLIAWNLTNVFFSSNTSHSCWEWNIQLGQERPTYT